MSEKAFAYATTHRDALRSSAGRAEVRGLLRSTLRKLGTVTRLSMFHIDRPGEPSKMDAFLDDDLRTLGYLSVGVVADVERDQ